MGSTGLRGQCAAVGDGVLRRRSIDVQAEGRRSGEKADELAEASHAD